MIELHRRVEAFKKTDFRQHKKRYQALLNGQDPKILFITCSDSRVMPQSLLQASPGEIFPIRNAGNIVPPYGGNGESATIEYALTALNIEHIIVCGHSQCGAMKGLLDPESTKAMPMVQDWLKHAPDTASMKGTSCKQTQQYSLNQAIQNNVLLQLEHLKNHPSVKEKLQSGDITLHGWVYAFENAKVLAYNHQSDRFEPLVPSQPLKQSNNALYLLSGISLLLIGVSGALALTAVISITAACLCIVATLASATTSYLIAKQGFFSCQNTPTYCHESSEYQPAQAI